MLNIAISCNHERRLRFCSSNCAPYITGAWHYDFVTLCGGIMSTIIAVIVIGAAAIGLFLFFDKLANEE